MEIRIGDMKTCQVNFKTFDIFNTSTIVMFSCLYLDLDDPQGGGGGVNGTQWLIICLILTRVQQRSVYLIT